MKEPVDPRFSGRCRLLQILTKKTPTRLSSPRSHQQLARLAESGIPALIIDDSILELRGRAAEAGRADLAWLTVCDDDGTCARLGHCPRFEQRKAETTFE